MTISSAPAAARPRPDRLVLLVLAISFAVFALFTDHLIEEVRWPTGDEPYYLLMAHSLIHDHDLELTNNFNQGDYWHFYPGELYPRHESITTRPGLWSKHAPGVAVLVLPGYAWLDWRGAALTINLLAALLAANLYLLGREVSGRRWVGIFTWLVLSFTNPLGSYAPLIFPAIPAALFTIYAFRQARNDLIPADTPRTVLTGLCIGMLPWLNAQLIPLAAGLFLYILAAPKAAEDPGAARPRRSPRQTPPPPSWLRDWLVAAGGRLRGLAPLLAPLVLLGAVYLAYYYFLYSSFLPNWQDHAGSSDLQGTFVGLVGIFLDQQWGLLIHAPLLLLGFSGLLVMARRNRRELVWLAVIGLPYFLLIINYKQWWGEWCPPARYLAPLIPLLALPFARAVGALRSHAYLVVFGILAGLSFAIMGAFASQPALMYNHPVGRSNLLLWLAASGGPDLTRLVPTYFLDTDLERTVILTVVWAAGMTAIVWWGYRCAMREAGVK